LFCLHSALFMFVLLEAFICDDVSMPYIDVPSCLNRTGCLRLHLASSVRGCSHSLTQTCGDRRIVDISPEILPISLTPCRISIVRTCVCSLPCVVRLLRMFSFSPLNAFRLVSDCRATL
jgi:hypothetical protein